MARLPLFFLGIAIALAAGCNDQKSAPSGAGDDKIRAAMEKLPAEDRAIAEQQGKCPVSGEVLGSMGTPIKVMVKDKPIFICCKSCEKAVHDKPDEMLQKVEKFKSEVGPK
jgi:hypothetical protein